VWDIVMPAQKRANWITALYPNVHDVVTVPDPLEGDYKEHDDPKYAQVYADQLAFLGPFTHIFSSESYGVPFAEAFSRHGYIPQHITVDSARNLMPISGTQFREDMYQYRAYVDPLVYRSLIQKVVFVGTESTGKSTLAHLMAERMDTLNTSEYGRTRWEDLKSWGIEPAFHDLWEIGKTQYEQEQAAALHSNRFLFCDTNAWTTMMWSLMYHDVADARLIDLAWRTKDEYIWILCKNDFGWVDDGSRELKNGKAEAFQAKLHNNLIAWNIPFSVIKGDLEHRISSVKRILDKKSMYRGLSDT